ncbi:MAG: hypothetical protein F6K10_37045 [Moorea sp. SIO2B7]|nr:hypothetical protein [Moorena sp. SIO2B7]
MTKNIPPELVSNCSKATTFQPLTYPIPFYFIPLQKTTFNLDGGQGVKALANSYPSLGKNIALKWSSPHQAFRWARECSTRRDMRI